MASQRIPWQNLEIRSPICLLRELGDQCCKSNSKQDDCILESACCRVVLVLSCPKPSFTFRFPILVQFQWLQKVSVLFVGPLGSALQRVVCRLLNMTRASARVDQRGNQKGWFFGVIAAFPEHQQEFLAKNSVDYSVASYSPTACQIGQCFPKSRFPWVVPPHPVPFPQPGETFFFSATYSSPVSCQSTLYKDTLTHRYDQLKHHLLDQLWLTISIFQGGHMQSLVSASTGGSQHGGPTYFLAGGKGTPTGNSPLWCFLFASFSP